MKECCGPIEIKKIPGQDEQNQKFRKVLWIALVVNGLMFFVEVANGIHIGSVSLAADALDFLGDTANYGISLFLLGQSLRWRTKVSLIKGYSMFGYGCLVLALAIYRFVNASMPEPQTMGAVGVLAFIANGFVALLLYKFRNGDSNMQSVWICTRNDVIGNLAVILAALGVFSTQTGYPDLVVGGLMAILGLQGAFKIIKVANQEKN